MASHGRSRRDADLLLALELAQGRTLTEAAEKAGVAYRTAQRRNANPKFRRKVHRLRSRIVDESVGLLAKYATGAAVVLARLLADPDPAIRLRAACAILGRVDDAERSRLLEMTDDLQQRLDPPRGEWPDPVERPATLPAVPPGGKVLPGPGGGGEGAEGRKDDCREEGGE